MIEKLAVFIASRNPYTAQAGLYKKDEKIAAELGKAIHTMSLQQFTFFMLGHLSSTEMLLCIFVYRD